MLVLVLSHVSLRVSGCAVSMGEAAKPYVWEGRGILSHVMKFAGSLARKSHVSLRVSVCAVSMGEAAKPYVWEGVKV